MATSTHCCKRLVGQLSWASGLFPWLKCFNTMLWGAITAHVTEQYYQKWSKKKRPGQLFFVVRIWQPLAWVTLLVSGLIATPEPKLRIQRWTDVSTRSATMRIAFAHRCFTIRVRRHPLCQGRANGVARGRLGGWRISTCSVQSAATQPGNPSGNYTQRYWRSIRGCPVFVANLYVCSSPIPPLPCVQSCMLPAKPQP